MADVVTDERTLELIARTLLESFQPELIMLGGSRAWGMPREDSDYDLMVILRADVSSSEVERSAALALHSHGIWAEVRALTEAEYARQQNDPGFVAFRYARDGRVLYTRGTVPQRTPAPASVREPPREGLELWIKRAESDYRAAASLVVTADPPPDAICFHAYACVEKLLKALIIRSGTYPPRTHDLKELLAQLPPAILDDGVTVTVCTLLDALYPKSRYPGSAEPTHEEATLALDAARHVRNLVRPFLAR